MIKSHKNIAFRCSYCKKKNLFRLFSIKESNTTYSLVECNNCHLIITYPKPNNSILYKVHYHSYRSTREGQRFPFVIDFPMKLWRYLRAYRMALLTKKQPLIDVGCGQGLELQILKRLGITVFGHEYEKQYAVSLSTRTGIAMSYGDFEKNKYPRNYFRVISFLHSLEHIPNALSLLRNTRKNLKPHGYLLISVPNSKSVEARFFKKFWFHLDIPRHLYHFNEHFLTNYIESLGFRKTWQKHIAPEYDFFSLMQSSLNMLFLNNQNLFYKILLREQKKVTEDYIKLIPQLPFIILLIPVIVIVTPLFWICKFNGTIEMVFQKT